MGEGLCSGWGNQDGKSTDWNYATTAACERQALEDRCLFERLKGRCSSAASASRKLQWWRGTTRRLGRPVDTSRARVRQWLHTCGMLKLLQYHKVRTKDQARMPSRSTWSGDVSSDQNSSFIRNARNPTKLHTYNRKGKRSGNGTMLPFAIHEHLAMPS